MIYSKIEAKLDGKDLDILTKHHIKCVFQCEGYNSEILIGIVNGTMVFLSDTDDSWGASNVTNLERAERALNAYINKCCYDSIISESYEIDPIKDLFEETYLSLQYWEEYDTLDEYIDSCLCGYITY